MTTGSTHGSPQRDARTVRSRFKEFSIAAEVKTLHQETAWDRSGKNARTLIQQDHLRLTLITLKQGAGLKEHDVAGPLSIHLLSGGIRFTIDAEERDLSAGQVVVFETAAPHSITALEDSVVLVTIARPAIPI